MAPAKEGAPVTRRSVVEDLSKAVSPKWVDACIAGFALALSALLLHLVDQVMGSHALPLFNGGMLTTSIIFFGGPTPPPTKGFAICTIGAWAQLRCPLPDDGSASARALVPTCFCVLQDGGWLSLHPGRRNLPDLGPDRRDGKPLQALRWLLTPWLAGSAFLCGRLMLTRRRVVPAQGKFERHSATAATRRSREPQP